MRNKKTNKLNILNLTPKRLLDYEVNNDGLINVLVPRFKNHFLQKLAFQKRTPYIKANLDKIGSITWELIDGKRTSADIANLLTEKYGEELKQVYERIGIFLQKLNQNNFITFIEIMKNK